SVTLSGDPEALDELLGVCERDQVRAGRVAVDYAAHSAQVEALRDDLVSSLQHLEPQSGGVPFHSTVTGGLLDTAELGEEYWFRNLREVVSFEPAIRQLATEGHGLFVEVSPHPILVPAIQDTVDDAGAAGVVLGSLRRDDAGATRMVTSLAQAWVHGAPVDWSPLFPNNRVVDLPTYPFEHQRFWPTPQAQV